jgi:hypothetical protein
MSRKFVTLFVIFSFDSSFSNELFDAFTDLSVYSFKGSDSTSDYAVSLLGCVPDIGITA